MISWSNILDLMTGEVLVSTIKEVLSNIGPFYEIPRIPQDRTSLRREKDQFVVFDLFYIKGKLTYDLPQVTAVPPTTDNSELKPYPSLPPKDVNHILNCLKDAVYKGPRSQHVTQTRWRPVYLLYISYLKKTSETRVIVTTKNMRK